jgi:hypothetical protein
MTNFLLELVDGVASFLSVAAVDDSGFAPERSDLPVSRSLSFFVTLEKNVYFG